MKTITVEYRHYGKTKTASFLVPENYTEMSPSQFLATIRLSKEWINEEMFFSQFFGFTRKELSRFNAYQLYKLSGMLDFLRKVRTSHREFYIKELPGELLAPEDALRSMCFQQFITADTFFSYYIVHEKSIFLDRFIATLYLKKNESFIAGTGEVEMDFEKRLEEVQQLPFDLKYAILINWVLIKSWLSKSYSYLFPEPTETQENNQGDKIKVKPADWLTLFDQFVGDNIADIPAYKALPCMDAFRIINRKIKDAKK